MIENRARKAFNESGHRPCQDEVVPTCPDFESVRSYVSESPVTATVPDETVNLRVNRLPHYRMMPGNVWDGC